MFRSLFGKVVFSGVLTLLAGNFVNGATYYVSVVTGDDAWVGSRERPFRTITKALSLLYGGDTCIVQGGVYREKVVVRTHGSPRRPVVIRAADGDTVIIAGTERIAAWEVGGDGLWRAVVPRRVLQLLAGGRRRPMAREPDLDPEEMFDTSRWLPVESSSDGTVIFSGPPVPSGWWDGGLCLFLTGKRWIMHRGRVVASGGRRLQCDTSALWGRLNPQVYLGGGSGCIYHLHALDKPGEWFWQDDTLYYKPFPGEEPSSLVVEARLRREGLLLDGCSHVVVKGITFVMATLSMEEAAACRVDRCTFLFPEPMFAYDNGWVRDQPAGKGYSITHWKGKGIALSGKGNALKDCYIAHSWGDGISVGGADNLVENCYVDDCDWSATDAAALSVTGSGHTIRHCTLRNTARSVLVHRHARHIRILHCDLGDAGRMCEDLGITYSFHTHGDSSVIAWNRVHDNHAGSTASGIYLDNYDTAYFVHHNVIWNVEIAIQTNKPAVGHRIFHNTAWHCRKAMHAWGREGTSVEDQLVANNLAERAWDVGTRFLNNVTTPDPEFVAPEHGDFTLRSGSPALDAGAVIPGITERYAGEAPDAGAFEHGLPPWTAGASLLLPDEKDIFQYMMKH